MSYKQNPRHVNKRVIGVMTARLETYKETCAKEIERREKKIAELKGELR